MKTGKVFLTNGIILTVTSLFLRWFTVSFNVYVSNVLGAEGMGVYTLVQSVFGFAVTVACSAVNLGTVRIVSEALARNNTAEVKQGFYKCILYSLFFSSLACISVFFGSGFIANVILGDNRTVLSLKALSIALPFISLTSVFSGYFTALRRVYKNAICMIIEHLTLVLVTVRSVSFFSLEKIEYACLGVAIGTVCAELISVLYNVIMWMYDIRKLKCSSPKNSSNMTKKLLGISLPLALSAYLRSGLVTVEHLLIPRGLRAHGESYSSSLISYGMIQGMAFPIIMFPSCLIYSFSGLLVPELSRLKENNSTKAINRIITKALKAAIIYSIGVSGILVCFSYELSGVLYQTTEVGEYILLFAPLVSVMYLDGVVDSILKGMNMQLDSMKINILDAVLSILLVGSLIPRFGLRGYILTVYICEIFNFGLSLSRLSLDKDIVKSVVKTAFKSLLCIIISLLIVVVLLNRFSLTLFENKVNIIIRMAVITLSYLTLCRVVTKK